MKKTQQRDTAIGIIADTHGQLREEAIAALQGTEHIIHAGDIGSDGIVERLAAIAPVTAIRGNVDTGAWATMYADTLRVDVAGLSIQVVHDLKESLTDPVAEGIDVVISGHSHKPHVYWQDDVLYVNPGSAGRRRFSLPVSLAILTLGPSGMTAQIHEIVQRPNKAG
jgi:uncharacterized protein